VLVVAIPPRLPDSAETRVIFERCVGRTFPVIGIATHGHVELEIGEVMGVPAYLHSIWIEPECLERVQSSD
jgi:hypothetical protein